MVAHSVPAKEIKAQAVRDGYLPMRHYGWHKVMQGLTTIEEVMSVTSAEVGGGEV
jgi:type II secretory ATPase GspE/PulE/Tfp pilus assembly ATPase PilB-like protein